MTLSNEEVEELMRLVGLTNRTELNCQQCLAEIAEFAEHEIAGKPIAQGLVAVRQHLAVCGECREEYEVLKQLLMVMDD